jgi:flagella basal body P-ring formation protein FlgA
MQRSLRIVIVFLLAGAVLSFSVFVSPPVLAVTTVMVPAHSQVHSDMIVLGEIAEIEGEDAALMEKLKSVTLGKAPSPGEMRNISADYLASRVRQNGIDPDMVALRLPETIEVARNTVIISPKEVEEIVRSFILKKMSWDPNLTSVKIAPVDSISLAAGKITHEVAPRRNEEYLGSTTLGLVFMVDGRAQKKIWVNADIDVSQKVVVCNKTLQRNHVITPDDIRLDTISLKEFPEDVITDPLEAIGKRTQRTIDINSPVRFKLLEIMPLVKRGDLVTIVAESDTVKITTQGVAIETGGKGEMVKVVNTGSQKEVYGKVKDTRMVEVDF